MTQNHPDPNTLSAYIDGKLRGDTRRELDTHIDQCETCYETVADAMFALQSIQAEAPQMAPTASRKKRLALWIPAVATALILGMVIGLQPWQPSASNNVTISQADQVLIGRWQRYDWGIELPESVMRQQTRGASDEMLQTLEASINASELSGAARQMVAFSLTGQPSLAALAMRDHSATDLETRNLEILLTLIQDSSSKTLMEAIKTLEQIHSEHPDHKMTLFNLAVMTEEANLADQSERYAKAYLALDASSTRAQLLKANLN